MFWVESDFTIYHKQDVLDWVLFIIKGFRTIVFIFIVITRPMSRVFANGLGDRGLIPGWVIPKTQKMVFDAALLTTQHYKVRIKCKVEQSRERSSALPYTLV